MGDLISRSALLKNKTRMTEYDESGCGVHVFVVKEEDVLDAPAVDAEVVRHGRWIFRMRPGGTWFCSECGHVSFLATKTSYCAHCGARMDGKGDA